jgi:DNA mismatch repair protein MutS
VTREVTRILTPGTVTDDAFVDASTELWVTAVETHGLHTAVAAGSVSKGQIELYDNLSDDALQTLMTRLAPQECLSQSTDSIPAHSRTVHTPPWHFSDDQLSRELDRTYGVSDLRGLGLGDVSAACRGALAALLTYLHDTQRTTLRHFSRPVVTRDDDRVVLDQTTQRNLELITTLRGESVHSLYWVINQTATAMGARELARWVTAPYRTDTIPNARLDHIEALMHAGILHDVRDRLRGIGDIERIIARIGLKSARPRDLTRLRDSLGELPALKACLGGCDQGVIATLGHALDPLNAVSELLMAALDDEPAVVISAGGVIRSGYDASLDELRRFSQDASTLLSEMEADARERTGIPALKLGYNRVHGYYFEVSKAVLATTAMPVDFQRRQTLKNAERFTTSELKTFEDQALSAESQALAKERALYDALLDQLSASIGALKALAEQLATLDCYHALAHIARMYHWVRPTLSAHPEIAIQGGRHPVIEHASSEPFIPNDTTLTQQSSLALITGPNMGGKSTYMRQTALIALLARMGSFVPAQSAQIGALDRIFTRIGASDDLAGGRSTFMVEMTETAAILTEATAQSLVLMDEVGRGTSTFDGLALAWSTAEALARRGALTLFATHYFELTRLPDSEDRAFNVHLTAQIAGDQIIFLHQVIDGPTSQSYGVHVARRAGVPEDVIGQAAAYLAELESSQLGLQAADNPQADLFQQPVDPLVQTLAGLECDDLSPREAWSTLEHLVTKARATLGDPSGNT